jgi:hypothetical protein
MTQIRNTSVADDGLWKAEIERDIGELKTDVATIKANDANTLKELKSISEALVDLRKAVNVKTPVWPAVAVGIAGLGLLGAIGLAVVSPLSDDLHELRVSHNSQGAELQELYYTMGKLEGKRENK